jgi:hypothetical protein
MMRLRCLARVTAVVAVVEVVTDDGIYLPTDTPKDAHGAVLNAIKSSNSAFPSSFASLKPRYRICALSLLEAFRFGGSRMQILMFTLSLVSQAPCLLFNSWRSITPAHQSLISCRKRSGTLDQQTCSVKKVPLYQLQIKRILHPEKYSTTE